MFETKINISNKAVAYYGAIIAVAAVFTYSLIVVIYSIIRSAVTIYNIMPIGERSNIVATNSFSIAYSVAVFSLLMAVISSVAGAVAALTIKQSLLQFNPQFNFRKAIIVSCITAFALLIILYFLLYALLKDWMTFDYVETFSFWFLIPAAIFFGVCIIGGSKLNKFYSDTVTVERKIS